MHACFISNQCHNMQIAQPASIYKNEHAVKNILLKLFHRPSYIRRHSH